MALTRSVFDDIRCLSGEIQMKIFALFVGVSLAAVSVFADNNDDLVRTSHQVDALISQNAGQLNLQQTAQVYELLSRVQQTIGKPLPPAPTPTPTPTSTPDFLACAADNPQVMQAAFTAIKAFAYAPNGYNLNDSDATNYATDWAQRYACSAADAFVKDGQNIRSMAYEPNGFNMNDYDATAYTKNALEQRCVSGVNFAQIGEGYYSFAYSPSGMNLNSSDASTYAQKQMNAKYFHCSGIHR
jgi:hypothetical protein